MMMIGRGEGGWNLLQEHVTRDLESHRPQKEQLVAQVDGVLVDVSVLGEPVCQRAGEVHAVELED